MKSKTQLSLLQRMLQISEITVIIPFIIFMIIGMCANKNFFNQQNWFMMLRTASFMGIVTIPVAFLLMTKSMDLSVGQAIASSGIIYGLLVVNVGMNPVLAIFITLLYGALIGIVNGLLVVDVGMPSFIVTLGMQFILQGIANYGCAGFAITGFPQWLMDFGDWRAFNFITADMIICLIIVAIGHFVLKYTVLGKSILLVGTNINAAKLSGLPVNAIRRGAHIFVSVMAAFVSILFIARTGQAEPTTGTEWDLQLMIASVIGGTSMYGGTGSIIGAILGMIFLRLMMNVLIMLGLSADWQYVGMGVAMIGAILLEVKRESYIESIKVE